MYLNYAIVKTDLNLYQSKFKMKSFLSLAQIDFYFIFIIKLKQSFN